MGRSVAIPSFVLVLLGGCAGTPPAPGAASCPDAPVTLPILSIAGAVVVPVTIDGHEAAAAITPRASTTTVIDDTGLDLYLRRPVALGSITGAGYGWLTYLHDLRLGSLRLGAPKVVFRADPAAAAIGGRRLTLVVGTDLLRGRRMLLDVPGRHVVLSCDMPSLPPGGPVTTVALGEGDSGQIDVVHAGLDRATLVMEINLSANDSIVAGDDAEAAGVSDAALAEDPRERTGGGAHRLGHRHHFGALRIGDAVVPEPRIDVEPGIAYDVLGLDFFLDKAAVFDFPDRTLRFRVTAPGASRSRSALFSGVGSRTVETSVTDVSGPP